MGNTIKIAIMSVAILVSAGSAFAGHEQGFDIDKYLQDVEAGTTLFER